MPPPSNFSDNFSALRVWKVAGQIGLVIVIPILVFLSLGRFIDVRMNTSPRYLFIGLVVAFVISMATLVVVVKRLNTETKK